jgi:hypothetical protein
MGGGSKTTEVKIPEWLEAAARENLARGQAVANIGYTPYYGPDVAAMTPMQMAAMQGTGSAAGAFGLPGGGMTGMEGMPSPQTFAGGVQGYSSGSLYDEAIAELQRRRPGQYDAITGMFIDPMTGAPPITSFAPPVALDETASQPVAAQRGGRDSDYSPTMGGGRGTMSFDTIGSYMPGGVNTSNPSSAVNRAAAALSGPQQAPTQADRPVSRSSGGGMGRGK